MDIDLIKSAAKGRWVEVLSSILGFSAEFLDGNHHPCPGCGGTDRFRLIDADAGACLCNQCLTSKNGDGIAVIQHYLGVNFIEAAKKVAEHLGVPTDSKQEKKKDKKVSDYIAVGELNHSLATIWASGKGVSVDSVVATGAKHGKYRKQYQVIAFPIWGDKRKLTGWSMYSAIAEGKLPKWKVKGQPPEWIKTKCCDGTESGLVYPSGWEKADVIWKVEGVTDMLAMNSALPPGQVAITNSNGAKETPRQWIRDLLAGKKIVVIGDADQPGIIGAEKWAKALSQKSDVTLIKLPYPVAKDHGPDVRDFLRERTIGELLALVGNTRSMEPSEEAIPATEEEDFEIYDECLKALRLNVLYETESGRVVVHCVSTKKTREISQVDRMKLETLIQLAGRPAIELIVNSEPDVGQFSISQVRKAIALAASGRPMDSDCDDFFGRGVWRSENDIVLVNGSHISIWDGNDLHLSHEAIHKDMIFRFGGEKSNWFEHCAMEQLLKQCQDPEFRKSTVNKMAEWVERWSWDCQEIAGELVTGMILATFIQSLFSWRPQISICGESNTGKTSFFQVLCGDSEAPGGIAGRLAWKVSDTTAAGIRQGVANHSVFITLDEWDGIKRKQEILKLLRSSGPGDKSVYGSSSHTSKKFGLRHLCWMAGVYSEIVDDADRNRFVSIDLVRPSASRWRAFRLPSQADATAMGEKLMAISIWGAIETARLAEELTKVEVATVHERQIRNLAVGAAAFSVACSTTWEVSKKVLETFASYYAAGSESEVIPAHSQVLEELLRSIIDCGPGQKRVIGDLLTSPGEYQSYAKTLESFGVAVKSHNGHQHLFIHEVKWREKSHENKIPWKSVKQILCRTPGAIRHQARMSGFVSRGVLIPWKFLTENFKLPEMNFHASEF